MPEVSTAARAVHFSANHHMAAIFGGADCAVQWSEKARPSAATLVLGPGVEQRLTAGCAGKRAVALLIVQRTRAGSFSTVLAKYTILFRREFRLPLVFCLLNRKSRILHSVSLSF